MGFCLAYTLQSAKIAQGICVFPIPHSSYRRAVGLYRTTDDGGAAGNEDSVVLHCFSRTEISNTDKRDTSAIP